MSEAIGASFAMFHMMQAAQHRNPPAKARARAHRQYEAAQHRTDTTTWQAPTSSADTEIRSALTQLRGRSRALGRDSPYAKRAKRIVTQNVVFTGIGMQPQVRNEGRVLQKALNDSIGEEFEHWACDAESCHMGGELALSEFEQQAMDQTFEAGEVFIRLHTEKPGPSRVPLSLEMIESELCPHEIEPYIGFVGPKLRMGIEHNAFMRPQRYWFRQAHPGEPYWDPERTPERVYSVPATDVIHLRMIDRWPQVRGVPWMHSVADTLNNMRGYTFSEIVAARGAANYLGSLKRSSWEPVEGSPEDGEEERQTGSRYITLEPGTILTPDPGDEFQLHSPNRPNAALDPFMRFMLREVAAGIGVSYESLSRDYSQSNYSSSRLALLDDRDLWRVLQMWFIRRFRARLHREWMKRAMYANAIEGADLMAYLEEPRLYEAAKWKPRGWTWIDPAREITAAKEAIKGGLTTRTTQIAATGGGMDIDDLDEERKQELANAKALGLEFDTDPGADDPKPVAGSVPPKKKTPADNADALDAADEQDAKERKQRMRVIA